MSKIRSFRVCRIERYDALGVTCYVPCGSIHVTPSSSKLDFTKDIWYNAPSKDLLCSLFDVNPGEGVVVRTRSDGWFWIYRRGEAGSCGLLQELEANELNEEEILDRSRNRRSPGRFDPQGPPVWMTTR